MAIAAAIGPLVSGGLGLIQGAYQAQIANMNAKIANQNADRATEVAGINAQDNDMQTLALLGEQEAAQASSGVAISGKSQVLTRASAKKVGRRDTLNIIDQGNMESYNHKVEAANFKAEAGNAMISGIGSFVGGLVGAAGNMPASLMGGAKSVSSASKYIAKPLPKPTTLPKYAMPIGPQRPSSGSFIMKTKPVWKPINRGQF